MIIECLLMRAKPPNRSDSAIDEVSAAAGLPNGASISFGEVLGRWDGGGVTSLPVLADGHGRWKMDGVLVINAMGASMFVIGFVQPEDLCRSRDAFWGSAFLIVTCRRPFFRSH